MDNLLNVCAIIPSLNPSEKLVEVTDNLKKVFKYIIIVDDGSSSDKHFNTVSKNCDVIRHCKNFGKGRAIKTALNHYMNEYSDKCSGVVLADDDCQHRIEDIKKCAEEMLKTPKSLILGTRNFNQSNVPFKSKWGNKITSFVFKTLCGINCSDTQTGLRALSNEIILKFTDISGERFEYETNVLLMTKEFDIPLKEVPIETVYIENNRSSHFNPIKDSLSIYKVVMKFAWSSILSAVIDILVYTLTLIPFSFLGIKYQILIATLTSRILSSLFNYFTNMTFVFKRKKLPSVSMFKYYVLCIVQLTISWLGVSALCGYMHFDKIIAKIVVDLLLFFISFPIQREWVFKNKPKELKVCTNIQENQQEKHPQ